MAREIVLLAHNIRSTHNIGSLLRTADGFGVSRVFLTGYTPYPKQTNDSRLPHLADKLNRQISKTALGAENSVRWEHRPDILDVISQLRQDGFQVVALEQTPHSVKLPDYRPAAKTAIVVGREVEGLETEVIEACDTAVEIPMLGTKESFNVASAAAVGLYYFRYA